MELALSSTRRTGRATRRVEWPRVPRARNRLVRGAAEHWPAQAHVGASSRSAASHAREGARCAPDRMCRRGGRAGAWLIDGRSAERSCACQRVPRGGTRLLCPSCDQFRRGARVPIATMRRSSSRGGNEPSPVTICRRRRLTGPSPRNRCARPGDAAFPERGIAAPQSAPVQDFRAHRPDPLARAARHARFGPAPATRCESTQLTQHPAEQRNRSRLPRGGRRRSLARDPRRPDRSVGESENVVAGVVGDAGFERGDVERVRLSCEQGELVDLLRRREQVAFDAFGQPARSRRAPAATPRLAMRAPIQPAIPRASAARPERRGRFARSP